MTSRPAFLSLFLINRESERCLSFNIHSTGSSEFGEWLSYIALPAGQTSYTNFWAPGVPDGASVSTWLSTVWWPEKQHLSEEIGWIVCGLLRMLFLASTFPTVTEPTLFIWLLSPQGSFLLLLIKKKEGGGLLNRVHFTNIEKSEFFHTYLSEVCVLVWFLVLMQLAGLRVVWVSIWTLEVVQKKSFETISGSFYFLVFHFSSSFPLPLPSHSLIPASNSLPLVTTVFLLTSTLTDKENINSKIT